MTMDDDRHQTKMMIRDKTTIWRVHYIKIGKTDKIDKRKESILHRVISDAGLQYAQIDLILS